MPRKYAFVYATGDGRHPGEVKIGNTSGETAEAALAKVTSRYKTTYGRCPVVYEFVPVALPKKDAEDIIKLMLAPWHNCLELYDLPTVDVDDTRRFLDLVYADLEVPFSAAHFVDVPSAADRKAELVRQREEVVACEEERVERKRARVELQRERDDRAHEDREMRRLAQHLEEELEEDAKRERREERAMRDAGPDLVQWVERHVRQREGAWFTLKEAHGLFRGCGGKLGRNKFRDRVEMALQRGCFYSEKKINGVGRAGVFWGFQMNIG